MKNVIDERPAALVPGAERGLHLALRHIDSCQHSRRVIVIWIDCQSVVQLGFCSFPIVVLEEQIRKLILKTRILRVPPAALLQSIFGALKLLELDVGETEFQIGVRCWSACQRIGKNRHGLDGVAAIHGLAGFFDLSVSYYIDSNN